MHTPAQTTSELQPKLAARFNHLPLPLQQALRAARRQQAHAILELRKHNRRLTARIQKPLGYLIGAEARFTRYASATGVSPLRLLQVIRLREGLTGRQRDLSAQQPTVAPAMQAHQHQLDVLKQQAALHAAQVFGLQLYLNLRQKFLIELRQCATGTHPLRSSSPSCFDNIDAKITNVHAYTAFHGEEAREKDFDGYTPDYLQYRDHVLTGFVNAFKADTALNGPVLVLKEDTVNNSDFQRSAWVASGRKLHPVKTINLQLAAPPLRRAA